MSEVISCSCTKLYHTGGVPQGYINYKNFTSSSVIAGIVASTTYVLGADLTTTVKGY